MHCRPGKRTWPPGCLVLFTSSLLTFPWLLFSKPAENSNLEIHRFQNQSEPIRFAPLQPRQPPGTRHCAGELLNSRVCPLRLWCPFGESAFCHLCNAKIFISLCEPTPTRSLPPQYIPQMPSVTTPARSPPKFFLELLPASAALHRERPLGQRRMTQHDSSRSLQSL